MGRTVLESPVLIGPEQSAFQHYIWTAILMLWHVGVTVWFIIRLLNIDTASLFIGIMFVPLASILVGGLVIGLCYWAFTEIRDLIMAIKERRGGQADPKTYGRVQNAVLAIYGGYVVGIVSLVLSVAPFVLYVTLYTSASFNDQNASATIYPIVTPISILQLFVYVADAITLLVSLITLASYSYILLAGPARYFDHSRMMRESGLGATAANKATGGLMLDAPAAQKAVAVQQQAVAARPMVRV